MLTQLPYGGKRMFKGDQPMLTKDEYTALRLLNDTYEAARKQLCKSPTCVTPEEQAILPPSPTNRQRSQIETYEFINEPPYRYFAYVEERKTGGWKMNTWTGDLLGEVSYGHRYRSNMGDERINITVKAINGYVYHGTYYCGAGQYCRIKASVNKKVDQTWLSNNVTALVQAIILEEAYDRLPILADALEDAGCTNQDILRWCRQSRRQWFKADCWVIEVLAKAAGTPWHWREKK